jgi:hypothetical protein
VPPLRAGPFWQWFSEVVLFANTLAQVVCFVKNSAASRFQQGCLELPNAPHASVCVIDNEKDEQGRLIVHDSFDE